MSIPTFVKQSSETIDYVFDFTYALNTSDTVASAATPTVVTLDPAPSPDVQPTIGSTTVISPAVGVKVRISGGTDTGLYEFTCLATTAAGEILEGNFKLRIKDL